MINNTRSKVIYVISDRIPIQSGYMITFPYFDESNIKVIITDGKTEVTVDPSNYTVVTVGTVPYLRFVSGYTFPEEVTKIVISREMEIFQETDLANGEIIDAEQLERVFDMIVAICQQLDEKLSRTLMTTSAESSPIIIPESDQRAGHLLGFDDSGKITLALTIDIQQKLNEAYLNIQEYVENTSYPELDDYVLDTSKPSLDTYVENTSKPAINAHVATKKTELDDYESLKETHLNSYTAEKKAELDSYVTDVKKPELDAYELEKENEIQAKVDSFTDYSDTQNRLNELKGDLDKEQKNNVRYFVENVIKSVSFKSNSIRWYNTGVIDWHSTYSRSDLFTCKPNNLYTLVTTGNPHICYFDIDKNYISGTISKSFTTPQNCVYLCVSIEGDLVEDLVLNSKTNETLDMLIGFNGELNDSAIIKDDFFLMYNTGFETYNGEYCYTSNYIPVGAKSKIGLNIGGCHTCFYDKDKKYLGGSVISGFVTPTECAYMRVSFKKTLKSKLKIYKANEQFVILGDGGFSDFDNALNCARALKLPIKILGGNYDIGFYSGSGLYCDVSIYGVGMPTLYANKDSFDVNFSPINMVNNRDVIIDGVKIVATNCRYAIHDEMGSNGENDFYKHTIRNCIIEQNTDIQSSFTYPRCIGIGMGNNGQILIENCILKSNVPEEIDAHTGYNGQIKDCTVIIKDCVMETGTVSATSIDIDDNFKDTVIVTNCLVNAVPFINSSTKDNLKFIQYNNKVIE